MKTHIIIDNVIVDTMLNPCDLILSEFYHFLGDIKLHTVGQTVRGGGHLNIVAWPRDHYHRQLLKLAFVIIVKETR